jgi:hypothetical protein
MKPTLKPSAIKRLKLYYIELLSSFAFNFNLRRYSKEKKRVEKERKEKEREGNKVRRCRLNLSNPC